MSTRAYPLLFQPVYQDYIWGGQRIAATYGRTIDMPVCAESWEVSGRREGMSHVINGPLAGQSLLDVINVLGDQVVGTAHSGSRFPLLIKLTDAARTLSVQVHPDDAQAAELGGEAKTEMWVILDAQPGAAVYLGLREGTTAEMFSEAIGEGAVEPLLHRIEVKSGDSVFVPGGTMHAIAEGCLLLEIQQNSNTTYRVYDWGRLGHDGQPRELHIDQALAVTHWTGPGALLAGVMVRESPAVSIREIVCCPYFHIQEFCLRAELDVSNDGRSFHAVFVASGEVVIESDAEPVSVSAGSTCLIPAGLSRYRLVSTVDSTTLIHISTERVEF